MERLNEFLSEEPDFKSGEYIPDSFQGNIEFRNVSFTYPNKGTTALQNVSFTLAAGESLGILGKTGAGKVLSLHY